MKKISLFYILIIVLVLFVLGCGGGGGEIKPEASYVGCYPKGTSPSSSSTPVAAGSLNAETFGGYYPGGQGDMPTTCYDERPDQPCLDDCNNFNQNCNPPSCTDKDCNDECPKKAPGPGVEGSREISGWGWVWDGNPQCSTNKYEAVTIYEADSEEKACGCITDSYFNAAGGGCCGDDWLIGSSSGPSGGVVYGTKLVKISGKVLEKITGRAEDAGGGDIGPTGGAGDTESAPDASSNPTGPSPSPDGGNPSENSQTTSTTTSTSTTSTASSSTVTQTGNGPAAFESLDGGNPDNPDRSEAFCSNCKLGNNIGSRLWDSEAGACCGDDVADWPACPEGGDCDNPDWSEASCSACPLGENQGARDWGEGGCCGDDGDDCSVQAGNSMCVFEGENARWKNAQPTGDIYYLGCVNSEYVADGGWVKCASPWKRNVASHDYICKPQGRQTITECCGDNSCNSDSVDGKRLTTGEKIEFGYAIQLAGNNLQKPEADYTIATGLVAGITGMAACPAGIPGTPCTDDGPGCGCDWCCPDGVNKIIGCGRCDGRTIPECRAHPTCQGTTITPSQLTPVYQFASGWVFQPGVHDNRIFVPGGGNQNKLAVFDGTTWTIENNVGNLYEDEGPVIEYAGKAYLITESRQGIYVRDDTTRAWALSKSYNFQSTGEYGGFGAVVFNNKLYTAISQAMPDAFAPSDLYVYSFNGASWVKEKTFAGGGEVLRAWALGSDGANLYIGGGRRARGSSFLGLQRCNAAMQCVKEAGFSAQSFVQAFGTMFAGGNDGNIYKRGSNGAWTSVKSTGAKFVISLHKANINGQEMVFAGTENPPKLFKTTDGAAWGEIYSTSGTGPIYAAVYSGKLYAAVFTGTSVTVLSSGTNGTIPPPSSSSTTYYCRTDSKFVTDLDTPWAQAKDAALNEKNKKTCEKAGFKWTGTKCCSEDDDPNEYYNDPDSVGGCWDKKLIRSISFVNNTNDSVINYGGSFHGCAIDKRNFNTQNDALLNLKDYHTKGQLIANHVYCFNDPNKNYYCSYKEKWLSTNGLDKTHLSYAPWISNTTNTTNTTLRAECCAATECWDGAKCLKNQRDNPLAEPLNGFRCIDGNWEEANKKFTMDESVSGYCPKISQCLVNPFEKNETNQCIESGTYVIKPGPYTVDDNYCDNGFWTSRTKLLALKMLKLKAQSNYTLFCDDRQSTLNNLNYIVEGEAAANILINIKTNNFCILKDGNKVVAGTTINKDIEDIPSTELNIFGVTSCSPSGLVNDGQYHSCDSNKKVWYNKKLRSIIYSATGIDNIPTDGSPVESFDQYIGNPIRGIVNTISSLITAPPADDSYKTAFKRFDRLYFTQTASSSGGTPVLRAITGSIEGRQKKNAVIGYTTFNDNVCNFIQSFNTAKNDSFSGLACKNQNNNYYVLVQGSTFTSINPSLIWPDLTAKIRLK